MGCQMDVVTFNIDAAQQLVHTLRREDQIELMLMGHTPHDAMMACLEHNRLPDAYAWAVADDMHWGNYVGLFGYQGNHVYSLWSDLSMGQSAEIIRKTPRWVLKMLEQSGQPCLRNLVHDCNTKAIRWLELSGCFEVERESGGIIVKGERLWPFHTKPLESIRERITDQDV